MAPSGFPGGTSLRAGFARAALLTQEGENVNPGRATSHDAVRNAPNLRSDINAHSTAVPTPATMRKGVLAQGDTTRRRFAPTCNRFPDFSVHERRALAGMTFVIENREYRHM